MSATPVEQPGQDKDLRVGAADAVVAGLQRQLDESERPYQSLLLSAADAAVLLARLEAAEGEGARLREAAEFLLNSLNSSTVAHHAWEQVGSAARGLREALFAQSEGLPS